MKLNKYLYKKFIEDHEEYVRPPDSWPITEEDVEDWIVEWYTSTYTNADGKGPRAPPMWLAGPRWYDRKKEKANEDSTDR